MFASRYGHMDLLDYLYKEGAQLEFERGYGCLHVACYGANNDVLKYLFEVGKVSCNPETSERTPLLISLGGNVSTDKIKKI